MSFIDYISTQKDEIIALRSIFGKEFKLYRPKNLKKKFESPCFSITVICSESIVGVELCTKLWFDCSSSYPTTAPQIELKDSYEISLAIQKDLIMLLKEKSLELLGTPMIHQLVEFARDYLYDKHKPVATSKAIIKEQQIIDSENKQREMKLQLLRERKDSAKKENNPEKYIEQCINLTHSDSASILRFDHCADKIPFDVYRGVCEGNHEVVEINVGGRMVISCFDGFHIAKGCCVKVNQVSLQNLSKKTIDHLKNDLLKKLEEDFFLLYKLNHCNVLPYLAFRYQITEKTSGGERIFELDVQYVTPNLGGMKLATLCSADVVSDGHGQISSYITISKIRLYLCQLLEGIRYLHDKNVTSIKLNLNSIPVDKEFNVKIAHYYIGKRFDELKIPKYRKENVNTAKKGSKRNDVIKLGKLAKRLFFYGMSLNEMKEEEIPCDLMGFIDSTRSNAVDLHNHPFLYSQAPSKENPEVHGTSPRTDDDFSAWKCFNKCSRIPTEFELIGKLGEGAFGDVVKVKNIYDSQYYAIKRVKLNAFRKKNSRRTMKEVQLLSSLNHENIVRYYASWSEDILATDSDTERSSTDVISNPSLVNNLSLGISIIKRRIINSSLLELEEATNRVNMDFMNNNSESSPRHFYDISSDSDDEDDSSESDDAASVVQCNPSVVSKKEYVNEISAKDSKLPGNKILKFLMIQMELCEGSCNTLHKYIVEEQLHLNDKLIWKFIREIVSGLEHIHSKNMIHRDLKPTNIFIDIHKKVKIGDLGLATNFNTKALDPSSTFLDESQLESNEKGPVGTILYICPEMLSHKPYNNKADMYSLGIIIFEMCHKSFSTSSERYKILGFIRQPEIILPSEKEFKIKDKFKDLILSLLNHEPSKRPSASELLESNVIPPPEAREMELRQRLNEITKDSSSTMYKLLLNNMFTHTSPKMGGYELPLLYQSPFKYYISNTKPHFLQAHKKKSFLAIDEGDYTFFTTKRLISRLIESIFISHGAVEFTAPLLSPKNVWKESHAFTLLDSEGIVVNLPANLRENFANFLLNNDIYSTRRYAIDYIYHRQEYRRDHPKEQLEAVFDIVSDYKSDNTTAEALYIVHEIFSKLFRSKHVNLKLEINHTELFHSIMEYYKIPDNIQQRILLLNHDKNNSDMSFLDSDEFKHAVSLSETQITHLKSILTYSGRLEDLEKFLKIFFNKSRENTYCKAISDAFNELLSIVQLLDRFPSPLTFEVLVRPIYLPKQHLYKGFVFQLVFDVQDKFVDYVKSMGQNNTKIIVKNLKIIKKLCHGGDYSHYLMRARRQMVSEEGDIMRYVSTVGLTIDLSTLIQCAYSIDQLVMATTEGCAMNKAVDVVVQYDPYFDAKCREMSSALWNIGLATLLYDKEDTAENYVLENKIQFLVEFVKEDDRRVTSDFRVIVMRNDCNIIGLEQVSSDDCKTIEKAIDILTKQHKWNNVSPLGFKRECHKQTSESSNSENFQEFDVKKAFFPKPEVGTVRYTYVFVRTKESRQNKIDLKYLVETNRQIQSLRSKNPDLDLTDIQMLPALNERLFNINKWFQNKFPNQFYILIVELSHDKCLKMTSEVSLKSLKDPTKLARIIASIELQLNYSINTDKHWKDVMSRLWKEIQEASKDKISRLIVHSLFDDNMIFVDIK